jgi:hypothetical protein
MERLKALDSVLARRGASLCSTTFLRFACELFTSTWRPGDDPSTTPMD